MEGSSGWAEYMNTDNGNEHSESLPRHEPDGKMKTWHIISLNIKESIANKQSNLHALHYSLNENGFFNVADAQGQNKNEENVWHRI